MMSTCTIGRFLGTRRDDPSIPVPTVSVTKDVPKHPANDPVLLFHAIGVSAEVVDDSGLRACHSIYS